MYLVEQMLDLNKKLQSAKIAQDKELIERRIKITDNRIDRLVYELYGLTETHVTHYNPPHPDKRKLGSVGKVIPGEESKIFHENNQEVPEDKSKIIKKEGRVIEALPNAFFRVLLEDGKELRGFLSGKMKLNRIKILTGDKVTLEISPYDEGKGRIVYRLK